ncbi:unnamed protein product [Bemisia tabaci]|uniref:Sema domain-containing protein n=1 Tax=Bemisia tabaci TaxID=7038 RepID=A0A9P0EXG5_BEMTA|nr:unnamed protein product [Bemisia tabaci]
MGSAICAFTLEDIDRAFAGKFKEQATSSSAWLPVLSNRVPEPRPGECVNDTATLPDTVLNFIRSHPLMDEAVGHRDHRPVFYKRDVLFTHLVVDTLSYDVFGHVLDYTVYYAGTNTGQVYKVVQWYNDDGEPFSSLLDIFDHKSLYVASDDRIRQIELVMCNRRYDNCLRCVHDPYCGWDKDSNTCKAYEPGGDKYISTSESGLVVVAVAESDAGRYDCQLGGALLCTFNLTVDAHRCAPPGKNADYHKVYSDWCHEFQKYKHAMKTWEKKQAQCSSRQNDTSLLNQNSHPNDIFRNSID